MLYNYNVLMYAMLYYVFIDTYVKKIENTELREFRKKKLKVNLKFK